MKKFFLILLLSSFLIPLSAFANSIMLTGAQLLDYCQVTLDIFDKNFGRVQKENEFSQGSKGGQCQGYLKSVNEMHVLSKHPFCLPENIEILQVATLVVRYLKDHPHELSSPASLLVLNAYQRYFPCR